MTSLRELVEGCVWVGTSAVLWRFMFWIAGSLGQEPAVPKASRSNETARQGLGLLETWDDVDPRPDPLPIAHNPPVGPRLPTRP